MKLASIKVASPKNQSEARDGRLVVVSADGKALATDPNGKYPTLLSAIEDWKQAESYLRNLSADLSNGRLKPSSEVNKSEFLAPLPRSYAWLDGSAFVQHVILVRKARGAELPEDLYTVPLMYQGASDNLLGPTSDITHLNQDYGLDFEGEIAVIVDDVPVGTKAVEAEAHIKLFMLMNDISLRNLIPREVGTGFGFVQSKPPSAFAPFAVTPDELGNSWKEGRLHLALISRLNGELFGQPNAGEMHFSFFDLIAHVALTRPLSAGSIIGSGTVSNKDESVGSSCLAEKRMLEKVNSGKITTPFMQVGDIIEMEVLHKGQNIFGTIRQKAVNN